MEDALLIVVAIFAMIPITLVLKKILDGMESNPSTPEKDDENKG